MAVKPFMAILVSAAVLGAGLAVANEFGLPPVSQGGELAYIRDYPADGIETAGSGEHLRATYVGFTFDDHPQRDRMVDYQSRGRVADTQLFHRIDAPDGTFGQMEFVAVDHVERGILATQGPSACAYLLNGVNAGHAFVAKENASVRYLVTGQFDVAMGDDGVEITRDGHTYLVQLTGDGNLSVDGGNIRAEMAPGSQLRGWIDREYPATTARMHGEFDDLAAHCGAGAVEEPAEQAQATGSDAAVNKTEIHDEEVVDYSIVVDSLGPENATGVTMQDTLPDVGSEWFLGGADAEQCVLDDLNLTCDFGTMEPGEGRSVVVTGYIRDACGRIDNTATASSPGDTNASNDEDTVSFMLAPCDDHHEDAGTADIDVSKLLIDQDEETVTFLVSLFNHGPDTAVGDGVYLNDSLPPTEGDWFIGGDDADACVQAGDFVSCHWAEVPANETVSFTATGYIRGMCGQMENTAVGWAENDHTPGNNQATAAADLGPCADAAVDKTAAQSGDAVVFTLAVSSIGDAAVENVSLGDELPDVGRTWLLGGADSEDCTLEGNTLRCSFGDLAPGESRSVQVKAYTDEIPCDAEDIENVAWITADNDSDASNDEDNAFIVAPAC